MTVPAPRVSEFCSVSFQLQSHAYEQCRVAKQIDLTAHKAQFATITGIGVGVNEQAVSRMYAVMDRRAD